MIVKLLTEHRLVILSLKGGCTSSSESTLVKMPHCWKSQDTAQIRMAEHMICLSASVNEINRYIGKTD